ncbi:TAXI family TRAP transporter solute-binding subunit [Mycolicibacterium wolinskyi]|uniref:TAXI family TRAP transporter solute-binding subunit n=1 Tax=Mycolicibacterium wolinskyi TaxID=59750 RepID=UPI0039176CE7
MSRRSVLRGIAMLSAGVSIASCRTGDDAPVRLAAGEQGGFFWEFSGLLAAAGARSATARIEPLQTNGSADNIEALRSGRAELAMSLLDTAQDSPDADALTAVGRVYENYFQVAVRDDSPITSPLDLRGRVVSVGAPGSGATSLSQRVLDAAGLAEPGAVRQVQQTMSDAAAALVAGDIDAAMWAGGLPTPAFDELSVGIRLLDLAAVVPILRQTHGTTYEPVSVPPDVYGHHPAVVTVGVANLLLARRDVPDHIVAAIVDLLLDDPSSLVPTQAIGSQFLDAQSLIQTGPIPLHPGAAAEYRRRHG